MIPKGRGGWRLILDLSSPEGWSVFLLHFRTLPNSSGSCGAVGPSKTGLDIDDLVPTVREVFTTGLAPSTQKVYKVGSARYVSCQEGRLTAFPVTEQVLMLFVSFLHKEGLAAVIAKSYLAAVQHEQISQGLGNPNMNLMPQLEYVLKGMKKAIPASLRRCLPITPEILLKLKAVWQRSPMCGMQRCYGLPLSFFGFLRLGEVVMPSEGEFDRQCHLCFEDVRVDSRASTSLLQVTIKASKTDPFRQGVAIYVGVTVGVCAQYEQS